MYHRYRTVTDEENEICWQQTCVYISKRESNESKPAVKNEFSLLMKWHEEESPRPTLRASCEPAGHTIIMSKVAKQRPVHTLDTVHYRFQLLCINKNVHYFQFGAHLKSQNSIGMFHGVVDNYKELFLQLQYTSWHCCRWIENTVFILYARKNIVSADMFIKNKATSTTCTLWTYCTVYVFSFLRFTCVCMYWT